MEFKPVIVVPVGSGRVENVQRVIACIKAQTVQPLGVVFVEDGPGDYPSKYMNDKEIIIMSQKHEPGREQPRNVGVRAAIHRWRDANAIWFIDSDVLFGPQTLEFYKERWEAVDHGRIMIGPYDWMHAGQIEIPTENANPDGRWPMILEDRWQDLTYESTEQLNVGLGCYSGNLVWPVDEFMKIGGFWNEIHHGRCEDGELGLRAVATGIPITCEPRARGFHQEHARNMEWILAANTRDVPMLNARHPWVQGHGLFVVEKDGKRFDQKCPKCGDLINTNEFWGHEKTCGLGLSS